MSTHNLSFGATLGEGISVSGQGSPLSLAPQVTDANGRFDTGLGFTTLTCQPPMAFGDFSAPLFTGPVGLGGGVITSSIPTTQFNGTLPSPQGMSEAVRGQTLTSASSLMGASSSSTMGMSRAVVGLTTSTSSSFLAGAGTGLAALEMSRAVAGLTTPTSSSFLAGAGAGSSARGMSEAVGGLQPPTCASSLVGASTGAAMGMSRAVRGFTTPTSSSFLAGAGSSGMSEAVRGSQPPTCASYLVGTSAGLGKSRAVRGLMSLTSPSPLAGTSSMGAGGVNLSRGAPLYPWLNPSTGEVRYHALPYDTRPRLEGFYSSNGPQQTVTTTSSTTSVSTTPLVAGPSRTDTVLTSQVSRPVYPTGMSWGDMPPVDPFAGGFIPLAGVHSSATPGGTEGVQLGPRVNSGPWMDYGGGILPTDTSSLLGVGPQPRPTPSNTSTGGNAMDVDSDGLPSEEDLEDEPPQHGGSYRRNQSAIAEASFRNSLEGLFDVLPNKLQRPPQVPDPQGYFSDDENPQKDSSSGDFLVLPLSGRNRHYLDSSSRTARETMARKLAQAQRSQNSCSNKMTLGLPIGVPHDVYRRMYTLNGEDWQRGLCPPNLHTAQASTLGLKLPPKEFLVSQDQITNLDQWAKTQVGISSTLQFFHSGISTLLGKMTSGFEQLQLAEDFDEIKTLISSMSEAAESASLLDAQMKRVVNSNSSIAGHQALQLTIISRDRWLSQMPDSVSPETILDLRTAPLRGEDLLDPQLLNLAAQQVSDRQQLLIRKDMERAAQVNLKREASKPLTSGSKHKKTRRGGKAPSSATPSVNALSNQMQNIQSALKALQAQKGATGGDSSSTQQSKKSSGKPPWSKGKSKKSSQNQRR